MSVEGTVNAQRRQRPRAVKKATPKKAAPKKATRSATGDEPDIRTPQVIYDEKPDAVIDVPSNPYAPTGWQAKERVEFDVVMPSGQRARLVRLEREDLFRLKLMDYLDTFTPILMGDHTEEKSQELIQEAIQENPESLNKMLQAIDQVVMASTLKPRVTEDDSLVNMGTPDDWVDPNFVATVPLKAIPVQERMFIFGAAFGKSMDDLKSLWRETESVGSLDDVAVVQQIAQ